MSTKFEKIARLANAPEQQAPIPEVPKLPEFFKQRFPDHAEELEAYNQQWIEFLKKTGTIAG